MAARPYWKGQLRLALVSIPVEIYSATKSGASISFRQIHEPSGKPVKYVKSVPGIGPVDVDDIMKGYEYEKGIMSFWKKMSWKQFGSNPRRRLN